MESSPIRPRGIIALFLLLLFSLPVYAGETMSLEEAIELGGEHAFMIQSKRQDSIAAAGSLKAVRADRMPTLSVSGTSYYIDFVPEIQFPAGPPIELGTKENYQLDLRLTLPLYTGGKLASRVNIMRENYYAENAGLAAEIMKNAYDCRKAYLSFMVSEAILGSAEASQERIKIIDRNIHRLYEHGLADSIDLLESAYALQEASRVINERTALRKNALVVLLQLLGLPPETDFEATETMPEPEERSFKKHHSIDNFGRPELEILNNRVNVARYQANLSRAEYFPAVSGFLGYSAGKPNRDFLNDEWNDNFIAGIKLSWELNLGFRTVHRTSSAHHQEYSAELFKRAQEEALILHANAALVGLQEAYATYSISKRQYELSAEKFRLAEKRQQAGRLTVNRLLEMEAELAASEQLYYASRVQYHIAETEYLYAVGSARIFGGI